MILKLYLGSKPGPQIRKEWVGGSGEVGTPKAAAKSIFSSNHKLSVMQNSDTQGLKIINYNNQS